MKRRSSATIRLESCCRVSIGGPTGRCGALFGLGVAHEALALRTIALASYLSACDALEGALSRASSREEEIAGLRERLPDPFLPAIALLLEDAAEAERQERGEQATAKREQAFLLAERSRSAKLREELSRRFAAEEQVALEGEDAALFARWQALQREFAELDARLRARGTRGGKALEEECGAQGEARTRLLRESEAVERELFAHNPEVAGLLSAELPSLAELRRDLAADEGLVAYLLDGKRLVSFCLDAQGLQAARVEEEPGLEPWLDALASCIAACERAGYPAPGGGGEAPEWQAALSALGARLLDLPASLGWLAGVKRRLTFVPSGALFALPFAALGLPGEGEYRPLIAAVEVALAPQAFTRLYQKGKGEGSRGAVAILNPDGSLGASAREAALLSQSLADIEVYRGDGPGAQTPLTARSLPALIAGRRLVHLTCHGRYEQTAPWQSKLIFAGEDGAPQSQLTALQIYGRLRSNHELIFAAACESGKGQVLAGDGFIGLHRALLFRARQVLATLFAVRDDATTDLERLFYRSYAEDGDAVAALAWAQRAFLAASPGGEGEPFSGYLPVAHPYWWAGVVVMD